MHIFYILVFLSYFCSLHLNCSSFLLYHLSGSSSALHYGCNGGSYHFFASRFNLFAHFDSKTFTKTAENNGSDKIHLSIFYQVNICLMSNIWCKILLSCIIVLEFNTNYSLQILVKMKNSTCVNNRRFPHWSYVNCNVTNHNLKQQVIIFKFKAIPKYFDRLT